MICTLEKKVISKPGATIYAEVVEFPPAVKEAIEQAFKEVTTDPVREVLIKARALVEKGWCQGQLHQTRRDWLFRTYEQHCTIGAFHAVTDYFGDAAERFKEANGIDNQSYGGTFGIIRWNDVPGRTKDQVLAAFDRAIAYNP